MNCNNIEEYLVDYIEGTLPKDKHLEVEKCIASSKEYQKEVEEMKILLGKISNSKMEIPSQKLQQNFDAFLTEEMQKETKVIAINTANNWKSYLRIAASILIILSAFLLGRYQSNNSSNGNKQKVLALLEDNSASKRILALTSTEEFSNKDTEIIKALIDRLFFDKNTNVRLAAAEALSKFSSDITVRDALIKSLKTDKNTTVQIEVIQILAKIQEKRAIQPMQKMLENEETPKYVKQQLELNLSSLL